MLTRRDFISGRFAVVLESGTRDRGRIIELVGQSMILIRAANVYESLLARCASAGS